MKRLFGVLPCLLCLLSLAACTKGPSPSMYIKSAQLTAEEETIAQLLGADTGCQIYDFFVDDTVISLQVNTYELVEGEWQMLMGNGGHQLSGAKGRMALEFQNIADGVRIAVQSQNHGGATSYRPEETEHPEGMGITTSWLTQQTEIVCEQEIPLAIQIHTSKNAIHSYDVSYFFQPEEYEKLGYEHVYAITARFSQKTVDELSNL